MPIPSSRSGASRSARTLEPKPHPASNPLGVSNLFPCSQPLYILSPHEPRVSEPARLQVDLRVLLRQGREAVQAAGEYPVMDASFTPSPVADLRTSGANPRASLELPGAAAAAPLGSAFLRLVNIGLPSLAAPAGAASPLRPASPSKTTNLRGSYGSVSSSLGEHVRVPPLTDTHGGPEGAAGAGGGAAGDTARGLALLHAHRPAVLEQLRRAGGRESACSAEDLQRAMVAARLPLSARQLSGACAWLSDQSEGRPLSLARLVMAGDARLRAHPAGGEALAGKAAALLGVMASRYGSAQRAAAAFADGGALGPREMGALLGALREAAPAAVALQDAEGPLLLRIIAGGTDGPASGPPSASPAAFGAFFALSVAGAGGVVADSEAGRKLARWQRVKASRQAERGEAAHEKRLLMEAARLMREAHKPQRIRAFLEQCISTTETIRPRFGEVCLVTYRLRNPFSEDRVVSIQVGPRPFPSLV